MQSISTLEDLDKNLSCVFANAGDVESSLLSTPVNGISNIFATPTSEGGALIPRTMINSIGRIATTDLFMSKIGCLNTYVNGVSYSKYAKLEYVDNSSIAHTVFATKNGLGNFNTKPSLISSTNWKNAGSSIIRLVEDFN